MSPPPIAAKGLDAGATSAATASPTPAPSTTDATPARAARGRGIRRDGADSGTDSAYVRAGGRRADVTEDWELRWSDEFDAAAGTPADPRYWTYETGGWGWGNDELQYYTDSTDNAAHDGEGNMVITTRAVEDPAAAGLECWYGDCEYTSARLVTEDKLEVKHGRIEARAQMPDGEAGIWPAIWSLGNDFREVGWPRTGEIDIMEFVGKLPEEIFGTIHGPGYSGGQPYGNTYDFGENLGGQWLTFSVEWEEGEIRWYVQRDGGEEILFQRFVELPFDAFDRAAEQPDGAADNGFGRTAVTGDEILLGGTDAAADAAPFAADGAVSVDRVQTLAEISNPTPGPGDGGPGDGDGDLAVTGAGNGLGGAMIAALLLLLGAVLIRRKVGRACPDRQVDTLR